MEREEKNRSLRSLGGPCYSRCGPLGRTGQQRVTRGLLHELDTAQPVTASFLKGSEDVDTREAISRSKQLGTGFKRLSKELLLFLNFA